MRRHLSLSKKVSLKNSRLTWIGDRAHRSTARKNPNFRPRRSQRQIRKVMTVNNPEGSKRLKKCSRHRSRPFWSRGNKTLTNLVKASRLSLQLYIDRGLFKAHQLIMNGTLIRVNLCCICLSKTACSLSNNQTLSFQSNLCQNISSKLEKRRSKRCQASIYKNRNCFKGKYQQNLSKTRKDS